MWSGAKLGVLLVVSDLDASVTFYTDGLGAEVLTQWDSYAHLALAGSSLHLATTGDPTPDKPGIRLGLPLADEATSELVLHVPDCRATHAQLRERGVRFLAPPTTPPWGGEIRCFLQDPDGHLIELTQLDS